MESNLVQDLTALRNLPSSWKVEDFNNVVSDISGGNKKTQKSDFLEDGDIAVIDQGKELIAGYVNDKDLIVKNLPPYIVFGDHTRIFKFIDFPFAMGADGTKVIKLINDKKDNLRYIFYFFNSLNIPNTGYNRHYKYLKDVKIPLPPLATQQKIAAILDAADELRQKDKALVAKYDELTQALFLDMFGDPVTNPKGWVTELLGNLCGVGSGKRVFSEELVESGIPFYRGTEIGHLSNNNEIKPSLFITKEHYEELKKHTGVPQIGDLLMPSICPDGRIFRVLNNNPFYFKDGRVLWLRIDSLKINSFYLTKLLKSIFSTNYSNIASGTTFAELKIVSLKKIVILTPPIKLQNQFAERVKAIEEQKSIAQASALKSEELFNSLLQKAFNGELI